jgi:hypothetical protein
VPADIEFAKVRQAIEWKLGGGHPRLFHCWLAFEQRSPTTDTYLFDYPMAVAVTLDDGSDLAYPVRVIMTPV